MTGLLSHGCMQTIVKQVCCLGERERERERERPDLSSSGEDPVLVTSSVVALPQSHLTSAVKTELGCGVSEGTWGNTAVRGHQQLRINISCKEVSVWSGLLFRQDIIWPRYQENEWQDRLSRRATAWREKIIIIFVNLIIDTSLSYSFEVSGLITSIRVRDKSKYNDKVRRSFWHSSEISPILTAISLTRSQK